MNGNQLPARAGRAWTMRRSAIVLALALIAAQGFALLADCPSRAGIRVEKVEGFILKGDPSQPMVRIRMHLYPEDGSGVDDSMDIKLTAPGYIGNTIFNPTGDFYSNKARTLVAFDIDQIGDSQVFLVVQGNAGVLVMRDFGNRVGNLCERAHHPEFDGDMVDVTKVVGDTVYLESEIQYTYADKYGMDMECFATVHVTPDGQLSLTSYQLKNVKDYLRM